MSSKPKFSKSIFADPDGLEMSVSEVAAAYIASQLQEFKSGAELCCAVGMMVVQLARYIPIVYGVDLNATRIAYARKNAQLYGVEDRAIFIQGDVLDPDVLTSLSVELAILDPDWSSSGEAKSQHVTDIDRMQPSLRQMIHLTRHYLTSSIVIRVPKEFSMDTLAEFGPHKLESIYIDNKLKFKVAYFLPTIKAPQETEAYLSI